MIGPFKLKAFESEASSSRELLFSYEWNDSALTLRYELIHIEDVLWPAPKTTARQFELWKSTCFELFIAHKNSKEYLEFNFSPSGEWDCYIFNDYRSPQPPKRFENCLVNFLNAEKPVLEVEVNCSWNKTDMIASATAVIETKTGIDYLAHKHAKAKPDFHDASTFSINLN